MKTCPKCYSDCQDHDRLCGVCGALLVAHEPDPDRFIGKVIAGNFLLKKRIGGGAMGSIYVAEQISLGKTICIKLLHEHLLGDASLAHRFHREARAAAKLKHPNSIQIIDFGQTNEGLLFMAMEYIAGRDLGDLLYREFPLDYGRIVHIMMQVASALAEAHAEGIIHRDLKPENIMVEDRRHEKDFVKVLDFGIAKITDRETSEADSFQTMTGVVCGTPEYMSPEQARGEKLDARSDLYALGVLLYQLLTNDLPFTGETAVEIVTKHLKDEPVPPRLLHPRIPPELEELTLSLMAKDRNLRPPSAMTVRDELEKIGQMIADGENRAVLDGDKTVPGLSLADAFPRYGDSDRTLVTMPPDFAAVAQRAAEPRQPEPALAHGNPAWAPQEPRRPAERSAAQRRKDPTTVTQAARVEDPISSAKRAAFPDRLVDVPRSRGAAGEGYGSEDLADTVPADRTSGDSSRWALVALGLVGVAVILYLGYLFLLADPVGRGSASPDSPASDGGRAATADVVAAAPTAVRTAAPPVQAVRVIVTDGEERAADDRARPAAPATAAPTSVAVVASLADVGGAEPVAAAGVDAGAAPADAGGAVGAAPDGEAPAAAAAEARQDDRRALRRAARERQRLAARVAEAEGDAARSRGDFATAIAQYRKARQHVRRAILLKKLGQCYNAQNDFANGARYLRQYMETLPEGDPARDMIARQIRD